MTAGRRGDLLVLVAIILLAVVARLIGLPTRGTWDADQGHDMLMLHRFVSDGAVPLLGPPTSIGTFHHGALYYWLLAPSALLSGSDPTVVTAFIALTGVGAVACVWWLAGSIGGPWAGAAAGVIAALSPAAIDEATFIWNPNLIPVAAGLALAAAWRAWSKARARWWLVAALGAMATAQLHVLGIVFVVPVGALLLVRIARTPWEGRIGLILVAVGAVVIVLAGYGPLAIHEIQNDGSETRAILAYLGGAGETAGSGVADRLWIVALRIVTWPFTGLLTVQPAVAALIAAFLILGVGWTIRRTSGQEREGVIWLSLSVTWCVLALAVAAPSLAVIVPGLPNDHYHAFVDPMLFVLAGVAIANVRGALGDAFPGNSRLAPAVAASAVVLVVLAGIRAWPSLIASDGGWPEARVVADRIATRSEGRTVELASLPAFKTAEAYEFPLVHAGHPVVTEPHTGQALVLVCDALFLDTIGAPCGGPAEDAFVRGRQDSEDLTLVDRFRSGPRRTISIYLREAP